MAKGLILPQPKQPVVISYSVEEEDLMTSEGEEAINKAGVMLNDIERATQISEGMDDLALVASDIEVISPKDVELIESATQMAVAGSSAEPESVIPSMEQYIGTRISTESIQDNARRIWEYIRKLVKRVMEFISAFWTNLTGSVPRLQKRVKALKEELKTVGDMIDQKSTIDISPSNTALQIGHRPVQTGMQLTVQTNALYLTVKEVFKDYTASVVNIGSVVTDALNGFEFDDKERHNAATAICEAVKTQFSKNSNFPAGKATTSAVENNPGFITESSSQLLGNHYLQLKIEDAPSTGKNGHTLISMERARLSGLQLLIQEGGDHHTSSSDGKMTTITKHDMERLLDVVEKMLEEVEKYRGGSDKKRLEDMSQKIGQASDKLAKVFESKKSDISVPTEQYYRALLNFNTAYARWMKEPTASLARLVVRVSQSVIVQVERSIRMHTTVS